MRITWDKYDEQIEKLANLVYQDDFKPDIIIAIARGGWIPTRYLSDLLCVKNIASIGIKYQDSSRTNLVTYSTPSVPEDCKKILLVEDMLESGKSMKWANEYYSKLGYEMKTASLFITKETTCMPDYYVDTVDKNLKFPWESNK